MAKKVRLADSSHSRQSRASYWETVKAVIRNPGKMRFAALHPRPGLSWLWPMLHIPWTAAIRALLPSSAFLRTLTAGTKK